ncbi:MAG: RluA family pseudouridine synthase [Myxococcales bacterium]|nr:RluA family pseudouridine synthase [Myxococcales bacterium]
MLRLLYRDEHVVVVDKPAGILTVPGRGGGSEALVAQVREQAPGAMAVHRLDRNTSGAVIFALGREAHRALNSAFEARRAEKTYLALVRGDVAAPRRITLPLADTRRGGMRVAEPGDKAGQPATTLVAPRERFGNYTLCDCIPKTGRTHQIRVHLSAIGHPLAVDPRYGEARPLHIGDLWSGAPDPDTIVLERTPLHAASLRVPHPRKGGWLLVESPLADDMARCLDLLRAARRES